MWNNFADKSRIDKVEQDVEQLKEKVSLLTKIVTRGDQFEATGNTNADTSMVRNDFDSTAYLGVYELSELCKVAQQTIYNWIYQKKIPYIKMNGRILFSKEEVRNFIKEREFKKGKRLF